MTTSRNGNLKFMARSNKVYLIMSKMNLINIQNFDYSSDGWKELRLAEPNISDWGERTLKSGLDGIAKKIVFEPNYICKDHRNLYSNFYSKKFRPNSPDCSRLHFLNNESRYLGYSVIRPVAERCLGRTVFNPELLGLSSENNAYVLKTKFCVQVGSEKIFTEGFPFMSQDSDATVCAHTALWSVCRYLSERYSIYPEKYPYDLIEMTGHHRGRTVPYRGMTYTDYCTILSEFQTSTIKSISY